MTNYTREGGVIPNHMRPRGDMAPDVGAVLGFVRKVVFAKDKDNVTGFLEYVVNIGGIDFFGVLDVTASGGIFNNHVRVRKGQTSDLKPDSSNIIGTEDKKNGDAVWCVYIGEGKEKPLIIGGAVHPRVSENSDFKTPTASLGGFERYEYNGLEFLIDKDGNLTVTQMGLKNPLTGKAVPPQKAYFKIDKDGNFEIKTTVGATISMKNTDDKITIKSKLGDVIDISAADGIQAEVPTGVKFSMKNGKYDLEAPQHITVTSTAGNVTVAGVGGAKMKLGAAKVGMGSPAGELLAELEKLAQAVIDDSTAAAAHVHPSAVGPTGPPVTAPLFTAAAFAATTMKGIITTLKGGI